MIHLLSNSSVIYNVMFSTIQLFICFTCATKFWNCVSSRTQAAISVSPCSRAVSSLALSSRSLTSSSCSACCRVFCARRSSSKSRDVRGPRGAAMPRGRRPAHRKERRSTLPRWNGPPARLYSGIELSLSLRFSCKSQNKLQLSIVSQTKHIQEKILKFQI